MHLYRDEIRPARPDMPDPASQPEFYENVPLKRLASFLIDSVVILFISLLIVPFTAFTALFFFGALGFLVGLLYRSATIAGSAATPGMWLMGIELRSFRGRRPDLPLAFAHSLLMQLSASMVLPALISAATMMLSPRRQGLHDMILGTTVINRPARS